ncbi:MAG: hypothetical protein SPE01_13430, partial [Candidatus Spyradocola sp.]|nr:hypothetical protein [Candidatus Spyradocola sp.]
IFSELQKNSRTALPHTNFSVSEAIFHLQIVRERMEKRSHPSIFFLTYTENRSSAGYTPPSAD